jgi:ribonuclease HI
MRNISIYTDGSHLKHTTGRLGIGGVMVDDDTNQELGRFSETLGLDWLKENYGTSDVSNPTCEMLANLWALRKFGKTLKDGDIVKMKADFMGVQNFNLGTWKARLPYIAKIKGETDKERANLSKGVVLEFQWVKAHQKKSILSTDRDAYWNDVVDKLAKGEV